MALHKALHNTRDYVVNNLDRSTIESLFEAAVNFIMERWEDCVFDRTKSEYIDELKAIVDSNRVFCDVFIDMKCNRMDDLKLRVDLRRKKFLAISTRHTKRKNDLNSVLRYF